MASKNQSSFSMVPMVLGFFLMFAISYAQPNQDQWRPFDVTESHHSILVTGLKFNRTSVRANQRIEIGVFTHDKVLCGALIWRGSQDGFAAYGADDNHEDYFQEGEEMQFYCWNPSTRQQLLMQATIEEGGLEWHNDGLTILSLENFPHFEEGWNLFSLNLVPSDQNLYIRDEGPDVIRMLAQLHRPDNGEHHVLLFKDLQGNFYRPANNFNNIPYWDLGKGYFVQVDEYIPASWSGNQIPADQDIRLREGWNIVPYYPNYQLSASEFSDFYVISSILDHVLIAKDDAGNFMIPQRAFSNMANWHKWKAYQIKVDEAVIFNYPVEQNQIQNDAGAGVKVDDDGGHFQEISRTGRNMSVLLNSGFEVKNCEFEISAFNAQDICIGHSRFITTNSELQIGLAIWGDDPSTEVIDGALEGEVLTFRLWDGKAERTISPAWEQHDGLKNLCYQTDSFASGVIGQTEMSDLPDQITLFPPSPNPFNSATKVSFTLPATSRVKLMVCDANGRLANLIADDVFTAGEHSLQFNGDGLGAGVYLLRLESGTNVTVQKAILVK